MPFSTEQLEQLEAKLDDARVHTRRKQGVDLRYLEGHDIINTANAIFGYHAWSYTITRLEYEAGVWVATVLLTVATSEPIVVDGHGLGKTITREDVGVGIPAARRDEEASPDAQETAIKGAVTDALKRALRSFGNAFGNSLYDKDQKTEEPAYTGSNGTTTPRRAAAGKPASEKQINYAAKLIRSKDPEEVAPFLHGKKLTELDSAEISALIEWAQ